MQDLVSTKEAAAILGVSTSTLENWRNRKIFGVPFFAADEMHGGTWYYYRERVEQLKAVYHPGILQNIYKLAELQARDPALSAVFQKPPTSRASLSTDIFTVEEAAKYLGVPVRTLQSWNKQKKLQPFIIDHKGDFFYSREQLVQQQANVERKLIGGQPLEDFFRDPAHKVVKKFNAQIYPTRTLCVPNDRFAKVLFNLSNDDFNDAIDSHESADLIEMKNHKKFGKIVSPFKLYTEEGEMFTISEPLDQFDCDVLTVCISEFNVGNRYITPAIIYRGLTGKVGRSDAEPSKDQLAAIISSIEKLMRLQVDITMNDSCEKLNYNGGQRFRIVATLLPSEYTVEATVNGKEATIVHLLEASPIWKVAFVKNHQVLSFDADLLDIPNQQNTRLNIMVKFYVLRRVLEIIAHKMTPAVTFADVFRKCRIENADRKTKLRAREFMLAFFEHLQAKELIKSYTLNKKGTGFYSVSITYSKSSK